MIQNLRQNGPKCIHVGSKNEAPHRVMGVVFEVFEALGGLGRFGRVLRPVLHGSWEENVANMAPSWPPKSSQHRLKIDAKIDQKFDASWDQILEGF